MSTTPSHPSMPSPPSPSPSIPQAPSTPRSRRDPHTAACSRPPSSGYSIQHEEVDDGDQFSGYDYDDYEGHIQCDLNSRVFVDLEVFLKRVFHVPDDWRTKWRPAIDAVKADVEFNEHHTKYRELSEKRGAPDDSSFPLLMEMVNATLDVLHRSVFEGIPAEKHQYYNRSCPQGEEQSPDWVNPLYIVNSHDDALCEGKNMPRLIIDGIDPTESHAPASLRRKTKPKTSRKRPADGPPAADPPAAKRLKATANSHQTSGSETSTAVGLEASPSPEPKPQQPVELGPDVCRCLSEMISIPLLRSHATFGLINLNRLQLYHANRSVILVSSAIDFSDGDGKDKFIATITALRCLSLEQHGILETLVPDNTDVPSGVKYGLTQQMSEIGFPGNEEVGPFTIKLGEVISREPAIVGRSTVVLSATSDQLPKRPLVIKVSWPTSNRGSEVDFLKKATGMAKGDHAWAAKHLPRIYYADEVPFLPNSTLGSVARLFENAEFKGEDYVYERRALRVIVQERLYPFESLASVKEVGQVFLDVACVHHWLYHYPGILHRDLNFRNIMYRSIKEEDDKGNWIKMAYGVLTDYDSSLWVADKGANHAETSKLLIGTRPYMAEELLRKASPIHLYRHDVESLFYIMLFAGAYYTIGTPEGQTEPCVVRRGLAEHPYQDWLSENRDRCLSAFKSGFFWNLDPIEISEEFEDFRPWLRYLQRRFHKGFRLRPCRDDPPSPGFDNETLGGMITYSTILEPVRRLSGKLSGLVIRDPRSPVP